MDRIDMRNFIKAIDGVCRLGGYLSAVCILLMTTLILLETAVRLAAGSSIFIAEEYSAYLMANFVMLGLAFTLRQGGHIKVTLLYSRCGPATRHVLRLAACLLGVFAFGTMAWEMFLLAADNYEFGQESMNITKTPIFIPQIGLILGSCLMVLQFAAEAMRDILALSGQDPEKSTAETGA